jgi:hypothetical protein
MVVNLLRCRSRVTKALPGTSAAAPAADGCLAASSASAAAGAELSMSVASSAATTADAAASDAAGVSWGLLLLLLAVFGAGGAVEVPTYDTNSRPAKADVNSTGVILTGNSGKPQAVIR